LFHPFQFTNGQVHKLCNGSSYRCFLTNQKDSFKPLNFTLIGGNSCKARILLSTTRYSNCQRAFVQLEDLVFVLNGIIQLMPFIPRLKPWVFWHFLIISFIKAKKGASCLAPLRVGRWNNTQEVGCPSLILELMNSTVSLRMERALSSALLWMMGSMAAAN